MLVEILQATHSPHPSQHPNRLNLLLLAYMAISVHRKPNFTMASQGMGRLGRHVCTAEIRDECVPHCVEVGVEALGVLVAEEV